MTSKRGVERFGGLLLLVFFITTAMAGAVAVPLVYDEVANTLRDINANTVGHQASLVFDWVSYITMVALAGVLYLLLRSHNRPLALLATFFLVAAGAILAVHDMINMALTSVANVTGHQLLKSTR